MTRHHQPKQKGMVLPSTVLPPQPSRASDVSFLSLRCHQSALMTECVPPGEAKLWKTSTVHFPRCLISISIGYSKLQEGPQRCNITTAQGRILPNCWQTMPCGVYYCTGLLQHICYLIAIRQVRMAQIAWRGGGGSIAPPPHTQSMFCLQRLTRRCASWCCVKI